MRVAVLVTVAGVLAGQTASLEGIATNSVNHEALSGVHIQLLALSEVIQEHQNEEPLTSLPQIYGATSDRAGRFSFPSLKPGLYMVMADGRGFIYPQPKDAGLRLKRGEHRTDFKIEMTPRAVISGRVVDEFGDPVQHVVVTADAISKDAAAAMNFNDSSTRQTDDRGIFRLSVLPGKYYVKATPTRSQDSGPPEIRTDGTVATDYGPTYFPSAGAKSAAAVVEARAGADPADIEIHLTRAPGTTLKITGVVTGVPDKEGGGVFVRCELVSPKGQMGGGGGGSAGPDGKFTVSHLEPGTYRIWAERWGEGAKLQSAAAEVKLQGSDATNVELRLMPGFEVAGVLEYPGEARGKRAEKAIIELRPTRGYGAQGSGETDAEGAFSVGKLHPGRYSLEVKSLPEGAYIESVEVDGAKVGDDGFELHGAGSRIKIVANRNGGQISGTVRDESGELLSDGLAAVVLLDDVKKLDRLGERQQLTTFVSAEGKYSFHGVKPGKYRVFALNVDLGSDDENNSDSFKKKVEAMEETEVGAGARIIKDLKVMPRKDDDAKKQ